MMSGKRGKLVAILVTTLAAGLVLFNTSAVFAGSAVNGSLTVNYDLTTGKFTCSHNTIGAFVQNGIPKVISGSETIYGNDVRYTKTESTTSITGGIRYKIHYSTTLQGIPSQFDIIFDILGSVNEINLSVDLLGNSGTAVVDGDFAMGTEPYPGRLAGESNYGVFSLSSGPVSSKTAKTLFNRFNDSAVSITGSAPDACIYHNPGTPADQYKFTSDAGSAALLLKTKVYTDVIKNQGYDYYTPIDKVNFPKAPAGWCSWYYYYQNVNQTEVINNLNWLADNLKKFGLEYVQVDDGWQGIGYGMEENRDWTTVCASDFPNGMQYIAGQIHARGLKAGLWLAPHGQSNADIFNAHPQWFLRNADGTPIPQSWEGLYLVDPTSADMMNNYWKTTLWGTLANTWGYDYFKIDGQPVVIDMYNQYQSRFSNTSISAAQAYRNTLDEIRNVIGSNKFILGCWGVPKNGMGIMNGSRTYWDEVVNWREMQVFIDAILNNNFLNNTAWWCDPDTLCVRDPLTLEEARTLTVAAAMSGEVLMTSDKMYELPAERVELLKRAFPVTDIRPMEFCGWPAARANIWDLKVEKSFDAWDTVAVFNWGDDETIDRTVNFADIGLNGSDTWLVYDFWNKKLLGEASGSFTASGIAPHACRVFAIHKKTGKPQVVSTSRHITQGSPDLDACSWNDGTMQLGGVSSVVGGDPYTVAIYMPDGYQFSSAYVSSGTYSTATEGRLLKFTVNSASNASITWSVSFSTGAPVLPGYFTLTSPQSMNMFCGESPVFTWTPSSNAAGYTFKLDDNPDFSSPIVNTNVGNVTSYSPGVSLDRMVSYYWMVTASNGSGTTEAVNNGTRFNVRLFDGQARQLGSITPTSYSQGWGDLHMDRSVGGNLLILNGVTYSNGLGTHANSSIKYDLRGQFERFTADVGVDDEAGISASVVFQVWADGTKIFDSGLMTEISATQHVDVSVSGSQQLELVVTDFEGIITNDHADWCNAMLIVKGAEEYEYLSDLNWVSATSGWGTVNKDLSVTGQTLLAPGGIAFAKGIGTHAASDIIYDISGKGYELFESYAGIDNEVNFAGSPASAVFQVWLDNVKVYDSGIMTAASPAKFISVDVKGHNQLKLTVTDAGDDISYDHADWLDAKLIRGWAVNDVGPVAAAGSASYSGGVFTVAGSGADIWSVPDEFCYTYRQVTGDFTIIARVASVQNTNDWAKAGVMIRETLDNDSKYADMVVTPSNGTAFQWRDVAGGLANSVSNSGTAPKYVKVVRSGDTFTAYQSDDGMTWSQVGTSRTITMNSTVYTGLAVTSHDDGTLCTATFDHVSIN